jgi:hypothetical protein
MKTILNTVRNFLLDKPIPEKVLTLLCSEDQESIDLAFSILDLTEYEYDARKNKTVSDKKNKLMNRIQRILLKRGYVIRLTGDYYNYDNKTFVKLTVRKLTAGEKYNYR